MVKFNVFSEYDVAHLVRDDYTVLTVPFSKGDFLFASEYGTRVMFVPGKSGLIPTWWEVEGDLENKAADVVTFNLLKWDDGSQFCVFVSVGTQERAKETNDMALAGMLELCRRQGVDLSGVTIYTDSCGGRRKGIFSVDGACHWVPTSKIPTNGGACYSEQECSVYEKASIKVTVNNLTLNSYNEWIGDVMGNPIYMMAIAYRCFHDFIGNNDYKMIIIKDGREFVLEG